MALDNYHDSVAVAPPSAERQREINSIVEQVLPQIESEDASLVLDGLLAAKEMSMEQDIAFPEVYAGLLGRAAVALSNPHVQSVIRAGQNAGFYPGF